MSSITVEVLKFCNAVEGDFLYFLNAGYKIIGAHPLLYKMACGGYADYTDDGFVSNWKTRYWR